MPTILYKRRKMHCYKDPKPVKVDPIYEDDVLTQRIGTIYLLQCNVLTHYTQMLRLALRYAREFSAIGKFRVALIDPPYDNTGCDLGYLTMNEKKWLDVFRFNDFLDDGIIFIWVTNAKLGQMIIYMRDRGWDYKENFSWNKYDQHGNHLRRGGYGVYHTHETCLMFQRNQRIRALDNYQVPRADINNIDTVMKGYKISQKPFEFYEVIEHIVPEGPYIEFFMREHSKRDNWVGVGDEAIFYKPKVKQIKHEKCPILLH
jgi:N6-adenosine-specific RNA methylase IME4